MVNYYQPEGVHLPVHCRTFERGERKDNSMSIAFRFAQRPSVRETRSEKGIMVFPSRSFNISSRTEELNPLLASRYSLLDLLHEYFLAILDDDASVGVVHGLSHDVVTGAAAFHVVLQVIDAC